MKWFVAVDIVLTAMLVAMGWHLGNAAGKALKSFSGIDKKR